jgi:hypothetical protein
MIDRNDYFLTIRMNTLWEAHFNDIERINSILIMFGRNTKTRLGSIKYNKERNQSLVTINGLLKIETVPEYVIDATIGHELIHYCHGFSSSHERKYNHPHQGGIILKEMKARDLYQTNLRSKRWLREHWPSHIATHLHTKPPSGWLHNWL